MHQPWGGSTHHFLDLVLRVVPEALGMLPDLLRALGRPSLALRTCPAANAVDSGQREGSNW